MIERKFVAEKIKEYLIQEYISETLSNVGHSQTKLQKTPLGEKIIIHASRPGLIVGRKGENIKKLTKSIKKKFNLENPQIEISEVEDVNLDANIVAERIASTLERFGSQKFKGISHRVMSDVMQTGALGVELVISGKVPSSRAKRWRFYTGYLKKSGDIATEEVRKAYTIAKLKTGIVGIQVRIMPPDLKLPDNITLTKELVQEEEVEAVEKKTKKIKKKSKKVKKTDKKNTEEKKEDQVDEKKAKETESKTEKPDKDNKDITKKDKSEKTEDKEDKK